MNKRSLSSIAIGRFVREKRAEFNYTQEELASKLGITKTAVSNWENGNAIVDVKYLVPLSNIFSVSVDDILFPDMKIDGEHLYCDISRQFRELIQFKPMGTGECKKILDLFVETRIEVIKLLKQYKESEDSALINRIIEANRFGLSVGLYRLLDEASVKKSVQKYSNFDDEVCSDCEMVVWANKKYEKDGSLASKLPHIFIPGGCLKYFLDEVHGDALGLVLSPNEAMLEFIYTFGGERIFKKYVQSFSEKWKNEKLRDLILFSRLVKKQDEFDKATRRAIVWMLKSGAELWVDGENKTQQLSILVM